MLKRLNFNLGATKTTWEYYLAISKSEGHLSLFLEAFFSRFLRDLEHDILIPDFFKIPN